MPFVFATAFVEHRLAAGLEWELEVAERQQLSQRRLAERKSFVTGPPTGHIITQLDVKSKAYQTLCLQLNEGDQEIRPE